MIRSASLDRCVAGTMDVDVVDRVEGKFSVPLRAL